MATLSAGDSGAADRRYPMSDTALQRLEQEEGRLFGMVRELSVGGSSAEAPDAAAVAGSILEVDAINRRLAAVRAAVAAAEVSARPDEAVIGRSVRVLEDGESDTFRLVIPGAGDPANGSISVDSPLGASLVGAHPGDRVQYATPGGVRSATVESVNDDDAAPL